MATREQLILDILGNDRASPALRATGRSASAASDDVAALAKRLDELGAKSEAARVSIDGDAQAQAQLDKLDLKMLQIGRRVMDPRITIDGAARTAAELSGLDAAFDKFGRKAEDAAGSGGKDGLSALIGFGGTGAGFAGGGMAGIVAAGTALAPALITLGAGIGGIGLAAYDAAKNTKLMGPILGPLKQDFNQFAKSLQPEVLGDFGKAAQVAGHLLHDIQPVAEATGKAIGGFLGQLDKEFQSGTWQQFFRFMANTATQDMRLLGNVFTGLLQDLPPLIEHLQPLSTGILHVAGSLTTMIGNLERGNTGLENFIKYAKQVGTTGVPQATHSAGLLGDALHLVEKAGTAGSQALRDWAFGSDKAAKSTSAYGQAVTQTKTPVQLIDEAIVKLTADMKKNDQGVLTNQQDEISWRQSIQAATQQLKSNAAGLEGNSKNALANKQAVLQSTQAAQALAEQEGKTQGGIGKATDVIQTQIRFLQSLHDKSGFARAEIKALRDEEARLRNIRQQIFVTGRGSWTVNQQTDVGAAKAGLAGALAGHAAGTAGAPPGWAWVGERGPELVHMRGGETVLPHHMSMAVTRGYASGVAGSYAGSVPGLTGFLGKETSQTVGAIAASVAGAIKSAITTTLSFSGARPGGGAPAANAALARKMMPAWGSGAEWAAWNAVAMAESGWNQFARNPSSGAYGIPQALPGSKMGPAANPPQSNPGAQIAWMISYIRTRYGDPVAAWQHEQAFHWYGGGLRGGLFTRPTVIGVGERGPERVDITPGGGRGNGPLVNIENYHSHSDADPRILASKISFQITAAGFG